jgi:hypothetical protein
MGRPSEETVRKLISHAVVPGPVESSGQAALSHSMPIVASSHRTGYTFEADGVYLRRRRTPHSALNRRVQ